MNCSAYLVSQLQRQCCVFLAQTSTLTIVFDVISVHLSLLSNHVLHGNYTMVEIKPNQRNWPFVRIQAFLIFLMNAVIILFLAFQSKVHLFIKLLAQLGDAMELLQCWIFFKESCSRGYLWGIFLIMLFI